jgi:F-type H+-transporting ATPase subunit b
MLIDWFTVVAQVVNFLILVWLLKRFLYKPILNAIDAREKRIAKELADAGAKMTEAQKERDEFQRKNEEFELQRTALMDKAKEEVKIERQRLFDEARNAADVLSAKRQEALINDAHNLNQALSQRARQEVFSIARKALADLAGTSLEERMAEVFTRRLREMDAPAKAILGEVLNKTSEPALVRSAFDLPAAQRTALQNALNETFSAAIAIRFETEPDLVSGIELSTNGQKVAWSIADYLASLGKGVDELLKEKDKSVADAQTKIQSKWKTQVGKRAYELYEQQGHKDGQAAQNWETAEREIRNENLGIGKAEAKPKSKTETKPETKVEAKSEAKPEAKPDAKPDIETKTKTGSEAVTEPAVKAEPKLATKAETEAASPASKST